MPLKPKEMPSDRWDSLKSRASKLATRGETTGTFGGYTKVYNQALNFFIKRWEGKAVGAPAWMKPLLSKKYPKKAVGKLKYI